MSLLASRHQADLVLQRFGVVEPWVDVEKIAKSLGLKVVRGNLGPDVSGLLVRTPQASHICVADGDGPTRQRFTIAHEIGHYVLKHQFEAGSHVHVDHGNYISQRGIRASQGVDRKEIEANQFAACLLMPKFLVAREVARFEKASLFDSQVVALAETFKVSEQAMTIRLASLGFL